MTIFLRALPGTTIVTTTHLASAGGGSVRFPASNAAPSLVGPSSKSGLHRIERGANSEISGVHFNLKMMPLAVTPEIAIPYLFADETFVDKEAAKASQWHRIARTIEQHIPGKKLPSVIGRMHYFRDGREFVYRASTGWGANFVFSYLPRGTGVAERKLMIQQVLRVYGIPHLPLRRDRRALALAREGITVQAWLPANALPLDAWAMEGKRGQSVVAEYRKKNHRMPVPDEFLHSFQLRIAQELKRSPSESEMLTALGEEIESGLGAEAKRELDEILDRIRAAEDNSLLVEGARARGWTFFPGEFSLIHFDGGGPDWTYNLYFRPRAKIGHRWFLASW